MIFIRECIYTLFFYWEYNEIEHEGCSGRGKTMKKNIVIWALIFVFVSVGLGIYFNDYANKKYAEKNIEGESIVTIAIVDGDKIVQVDDAGHFTEVFIKGVNVGLGVPGKFPGEVAIEKEQYLNWFVKIKELGANTIRVYTIQSPEFYVALNEFNMVSDPLYLIQGISMNEGEIKRLQDVYEPSIASEFEQEIKNAIDVIHGNASLDERPGHASGNYTVDVSKYTIMYLMGIEFDGNTIEKTNNLHMDRKGFEGEYLTTENATPFEAYLAMNGNTAISYETENYKKQTIISFANWPTSDPLNHPNEPDVKNTKIGFDTEHIKGTDKFVCGQVASYHIYPYYPDFLNFENQGEFVTSSSGNQYQDYLKRLNDHHTMPVVIAEYGVPTSRGMTHVDETRGFNQGSMNEEDQGHAIVQMTKDIQDAGLNGAMIFSWQDEWFKSVWNTLELVEPTGRVFWHDVQSSETSFGLLAFEPEKTKLASEAVVDEMDMDVYSDAAYLTVELSKDNFVLENQQIKLYFDVTPHSGIEELDNRKLEAPIDFYLELNGMQNGQMLVDPYYDNFMYLFANEMDYKLPIVKKTSLSSDELNPIRLRLRREWILPVSGETKEATYQNTGYFTYGTLDTSSKEYSQMNDYTMVDDKMTIRIPWLMLNFSDPSNGLIIQDFYANYKPYIEDMLLATEKIETIKIGVQVNDGEIQFVEVPLKNWTDFNYAERLKKSYDIVKEAWNHD